MRCLFLALATGKKSYNDDEMKLQLICQLHFKIEAYSFNAVYLNIAKIFKGLVTINIS